MNHSIHKYEGFKLLSLSVINHPILGTNEFYFVDQDDKPESIYFSVLIGPNGTGKSEILRTILTLFRNICRLDKGEKTTHIKGFYNLTYSNMGDIYSFTNLPVDFRHDFNIENESIRSKPYFVKNEEILSFENTSKTLPTSIIANSIMLTDKYFVPRNEKEQDMFPMYRYLGVRQRPQQASTRYYVRKTVEFIVDQIDSKAFNEGVKKVTKFLGTERSVHVLYKTLHTTRFFTGNLNIDKLDAYFFPIIEKYKNLEDKTAPFKATHYEKIRKDEDFLEELCDYVNDLHDKGRLEKIRRSSVKIIRYDIGVNNDYENLKREYKFLEELRILGIVKAPEVRMVEKNEIDIQNSSSGEFHFFSTMIGLMATIQPNSLILIDEPEISLHPNWQMRYLAFLRELFSDTVYRSCQILIATHSHFMISDLMANSSSIIGLNKENGEVKTIPLDIENTYGWSAEEVLLKVFKVPTTRNLYLAESVGEILDLVAKENRDEEEISKRVKVLLNQNILKLSTKDPLSTIVNKLVSKYA